MVDLAGGVGQQLTNLGAGILAVGAASSAAIGRSVAVFSEYGQSIDDISQRTGFTAEATSELAFAIEQSGGSIQTFETAARKMEQTLTKASEGGKQANATLGALGLSVGELQALSPDKQFELLAQKLSEIEDPATRVTRSLEIFGKSGQVLQPLLAGGAEAITDLRDQARALGVTLSSGDTAAAGAYGDAWDTVTKSLRGVQVQIGAAVAPVLTELFDEVSRGLGLAANFINQNRELVQILAAAAAGSVAAGTGITTLGLALRTASTGLGSVLSVASSLPLVGAAVGAVLSPIGLVATAAVAAGGAFLAFTDTGRQMGQTILTSFGVIKEIVVDTMGEVFNSLKGGDLLGAAQEAWFGIQEVAATAWQGIQLLVLQAIEGIRQQFPGLVAGATAAWNDLSTVTVTAWNAIQDVVVSVWAGVSQFFVDSWQSALDGFNTLTGGGVTAVSSYFGQLGDYFGDVTDGMFDSWADFTATIQTLWADAGTFLLQSFLNITSGILEGLATVAEFVAGENFISDALRDAERAVDEFNDAAAQGGNDRREEIERNRQRRKAEELQLQQQQVGQFSTQIAALQAAVSTKLDIPKIDNPLSQVATEAAKVRSEFGSIKAPELELKFQGAGSFSGLGAALIGNSRPQTLLVRQQEKMIGLLGRIAENTEVEDDAEVI